LLDQSLFMLNKFTECPGVNIVPWLHWLGSKQICHERSVFMEHLQENLSYWVLHLICQNMIKHPVILLKKFN
jgi:hypothetical protein